MFLFMRRAVACLAPVLALVIWLASAPVQGSERVFRLLDQRDGLPAGEVVRFVQDRRGFIWMGSFAGLIRYDGEEFRVWAPERLSGHISVLIANPEGDIHVRVEPGRPGAADPGALYRVLPEGIEPVLGPEGVPLSGITDAAFGDGGQLCVTQPTIVLCRLAGGAWVRHTFERDGPERPRWLRRGPAGAVLSATNLSLWQLDADGSQRLVAPLAGVTDTVPHPDGSYFASTHVGDASRLVRIADGQMTTLVTLEARPIDMALRGETVWTSFDRFVVVVRPGETPEVIGPESGLPSGGPLLVDHEGSLWLGTYSGVMHLSEPETVVWTERDGLPSTHTRFLEVAGDTMWVGTWQGLGRMGFAGGRWQARRWSAPGSDGMCLDAAGRLWAVNAAAGIVRHRPEGRTLFARPELESWLGCGRRPDGTLWLTTSAGLFVTDFIDRPPRLVAPNPEDPAGAIFFRRILQDSRGRLWVAANEQVCQAPADAVLREATPGWQCRQVTLSRGVSSLIELADGNLWLSTDRAGIWQYDDEADNWRQLPGSMSLPSYSLRRLVPSADGSVWILGHGTVVRVRDDHASPDGWTVVERLTGLQGLPSAAAEHILERPNGSRWIATIVGLVHVPASVRQRVLSPPAVELVDVVVNGRHADPAATTHRVEGTGAVELRFAALTYRDRGLLRYEYRMHPDADWTPAPTSSGVFRFPDLAPGSYAVSVRASLDGRTWTATPAGSSFDVLPPWYRRGWALTMLALALAGTLYVAHRLRLGFLLRLERQRARIAMDLHDEIGAGLGSINILAGLAAERTPPESHQASLVNEIADTAADLGASLGEIVWSLRSRSATLDGLAAHLSERAVKLFPAGRAPALTLRIPEVLPPLTLGVTVRWNVALIVHEALHNAARHARAAHVVLGLEPAGRRWRIWVEDDGRGLDERATAHAGGVGIENMRRRAAEIRGDFELFRGLSGGLTVSLIFDPHASPVRG
jgi:signal transduction histidine kinase